MSGSVRYGTAGVMALVCLGLGPGARAQDAAKQVQQELEETVKRFDRTVKETEAWHRREIDRISREAEGNAAALRDVLGQIQGMVLSSDDAYRAAVEKWEEVIRELREPARAGTHV